MKRHLILLSLSLSVGLISAPASAGFFLEGLKPFTQEPRCPDPYAKDKSGCEKPEMTAPEAPAPKPDVRSTTREGAPQK